MKKMPLFIVLVLASMSLTLPSCKTTSKTADAKLFKFNLQEGKSYDYELVWDLDTEVMGQTSSVSVSGLYSMDVAKIEGGVRSVETAYKSLKMSIIAMGMNLEVDSDNKETDNGEKDITKNPVGMMNKMVAGLVNKKFIIKVDEEGRVLEVIGLEKILTGMIDSMGIEGAARAQALASMKDQFSDQSVKDQFSQVFTIFPNKEIKVGDKWTKTFSTSGKMGGAYSTEYTVKGIEGDHVSLITRTKIASLSGGDDITGTQSGNMLVDSKTGLMINAEFDQDLKVKSEGQTVNIIGKGKIKGKETK